MNIDAKQLTQTAESLIAGFDATAHQLIGLYREGGDKLGQAARQRWDAAWKESSSQLSAETRRNAQHARKVFAGYYMRGVTLSAAGAEIAVATLVQAARTGVQRAEAWQAARA
jgi:hypothetical protein